MSRAFQLLELEAAELSIAKAFALALTDDTFLDITLQCSDGIPVHANRTILGLRSPVFRKMLFGNFQEATAKTVKVDFPSPVIYSVVKYIHTSKVEGAEVPLLRLLTNNNNHDDNEIPRDWQEKFLALLTLTAAAAYYSLPKLCREVNRYLSTYLATYPLLAFAVLDACSQEGPAISHDLKHSALSKTIKLLSDKRFDAKILANFSNGAIESILVYGKTLLSEQHRFLLIDQWCHPGSTDQDRGCIAKQLVKDHVDLQFIDPEYLSTTVTLSGLVTSEQLTEAYKSQAIQAKKKFKISFTKFTCPSPLWSDSNSATFANRISILKSDTLKCPILLAGSKYTWTVTINDEPDVWLGVVVSTKSPKFTGKEFDDEEFDEENSGCYGYYGDEYDFGHEARFKGGDCVKMTLDLALEEEDNGTLSVSVNNQPTVVICTDMLAKLPRHTNEGFVPAAACSMSKVTIESIEEV
jgi:BTB/POZ domain